MASKDNEVITDLDFEKGADEKNSRSTSPDEKMVQVEEVKPQVYEVPIKQGNRVTRFLQYTAFSTYRKLFTLVFIANLAAFIAILVKRHGHPKSTDVVTAVSANVMVASLFRQENFINVVYDLFTFAPHWLPLWVRKDFAKVYHYGGTHSGTGAASAVWMCLYVAVVTKEYILNPSQSSKAAISTAYILLMCFLFLIIFSYPSLRTTLHDNFEATHRFAGWTIIVVFWISFMIAAQEDRKRLGFSLGHYIAQTPTFWFLIVSTICIVLSWVRLRRREVFPERLSDHAIRLHFKYIQPKAFYNVRVSDSPLMEWHSFATIPDEDEEGRIIGYSFVVSNAGDWTNRIINNPPKTLWIRSDPQYGLHVIGRLFKRYVMVATGSGIGPILSLMQANLAVRRVLWSASKPEVTFGQGIINAVYKSDPKAIIWDTRERGRPDMIQLTTQLVKECDAEAVIIISNPKVTRFVVYGMETRGMACFGAIFDS